MESTPWERLALRCLAGLVTAFCVGIVAAGLLGIFADHWFVPGLLWVVVLAFLAGFWGGERVVKAALEALGSWGG